MKTIGKTKINTICQLCQEETKEDVNMYVGGFIAYAHPSCVEIAKNAIALYEKWILFTMKVLPDWQKKQAKIRKSVTTRRDKK